MRFALRPGLQLRSFYIGQTLHSALKQFKEESNGFGIPLWRQVEVHSPTDPLQPVIVAGLLEDGSKWAITFDGVHHLALTVSVTIDAPTGANGRILQLQEEEGDFPRHRKDARLLQAWVTSRGRPESLSSRCSATGLTVLEACTIGQGNTSSSGAEFVSKVMCNGVLLTLTHDTTPSSNVVVPPAFIPTSLQDLLPMDCYIIGLELIPGRSSPLLPLLCGGGTGKKSGAAHSSPIQAVPLVHMALAGSDGRILGICVSQQPPMSAPGSTLESHTAPYHGQRQVLFGDTMQSVVTELGAPESYYYRTYDNSEMFLRLPEGPTSLGQKVNCHRSDVFFNYFRLGLDVVFDAVSFTVKKFVLHASPPEAADFESYSRCHFRLACSRGRLSTDSVAQVVFSPSHKWSQVVSHVGTACRLQKVVCHRELEFLGHSYATHMWYSALGQCLVEVLSNDVISCICILPDVIDDSALPSVPSEDARLCIQQRDDQEYKEEEACPSLPSSLPSTADEFEDARSSFQTPSSSLGCQSSLKKDSLPASFLNVNVVLREAQRNTIPLTQVSLEGESDLSKSGDEVVVVPCFTDAEESDESETEEEAANADEEGGEEGGEVDFDATHELISRREDAETSLTSDFDVISSLGKDTEVAPEESTSPSSSTAMCDDSTEGDQLVTEPKTVLYKAGGGAMKASRLQDIIDSSQPPSGSKGGRTVVAVTVGGHAGEMPKKGSGKRGKQSKFELSEQETKRLQRLCRPTATSLQRGAKATAPMPPTAGGEQKPHELDKMGCDEQTTTRDLAVVTEEDETGDAIERNRTATEVDVTSRFQSGSMGGDMSEDEDEEDPDTALLDLLASPVLQPDTKVKQFRTSTFDRIFPAEPLEEDPKPVPKVESYSKQETKEDESFPSADPELSLGSFKDALLKQFDMIKDCNAKGSGQFTMKDCSCHGADGSSHGEQPTAEVDSGGRRLSERVGSTEGASTGAACPSGCCSEETVTSPIHPVVPDEAHNSSVIDDKAKAMSPCSDIPDDMGDVNRHSDTPPDFPSPEDEVALDTLRKGRWREGSPCVVPCALYQDKEEQLLSLNSSFIEDLTTDAVDMAARLHQRSKVMPEYLSSMLLSTWKGGLPSPPCELDGEEKQVLFVSALEVLLASKEIYFTLERCLSLLPRLNTLLSEVALIRGKEHACSVVCEVIEAVSMANMAVLDQYKAGMLRTSSKDHYTCQLCYNHFERIAETLEALHKKLSDGSSPSTSSEGKSNRNLLMVETARCAVNKILRQIEINPEKIVDLET